MEVTQSKHTVTAKPTQPQHWSSAHGRIKGRTIPRMPFNTIVLAGEISDDDNTISWSNQVVWTRVVGKEDDTDVEDAAAAGNAAEKGNTPPELADTGTVAKPNAPDGTDGEEQPAGSPPPPPPEEADKGNAAPAPGASSGGGDDSVKTKDSGTPSTVNGGGSGTELQKAKADTEKAKAEAKQARQELAESTAQSNAKQKSGRKELMSCREQTLSLQSAIEEKDQIIAVLYCAIGVLVVLLCFQSCRRLGSAADAADGDAAEEAEWAQSRHSQMRSQIAGSSSTLAKAL